MKIIEIASLNNGAHKNQNGGLSIVPAGWALIPEDIETPNFPFGDIEVEEIDGVMTVTKWTPGVMPDPEPEVIEPSQLDRIEAQITYTAMMTDTLMEV